MTKLTLQTKSNTIGACLNIHAPLSSSCYSLGYLLWLDQTLMRLESVTTRAVSRLQTSVQFNIDWAITGIENIINKLTKGFKVATISTSDKRADKSDKKAR